MCQLLNCNQDLYIDPITDMYILKRFLSTTPDYYLASTTVLIEDRHLFIFVPKPNQAGGHLQFTITIPIYMPIPIYSNYICLLYWSTNLTLLDIRYFKVDLTWARVY